MLLEKVGGSAPGAEGFANVSITIRAVDAQKLCPRLFASCTMMLTLTQSEHARTLRVMHTGPLQHMLSPCRRVVGIRVFRPPFNKGQDHLDFLGEVTNQGQGSAPQLGTCCLCPAQRMLQHAKAASLVERIPESLILLHADFCHPTNVQQGQDFIGVKAPKLVSCSFTQGAYKSFLNL